MDKKTEKKEIINKNRILIRERERVVKSKLSINQLSYILPLKTKS